MEIQFDKERLEQLLKDFYTLTKIKVDVFDSNGNRIAACPSEHTPFCAFVRSNAEVDAECIFSDKQAFAACKATKKRQIYTCRMGLTECVAPIVYQDTVVAYVMIGQIAGGNASNFDEIKNNVAKYDIDLNKAKKLYLNVKTQESSAINASFRIVDAIASLLYLEKIIDIDKKNTKVKINEYIANNIGGKLSVDEFCELLSSSRSECYKIFAKFFNQTVNSYVKSKRIATAKKLLLESNCSVSEIADIIGFSDYNYFSKVFKKSVGASPTDYKKSNRNN